MSDNINIIEIIKNIPNNLELTGSMLIVALVGILIVLVELGILAVLIQGISKIVRALEGAVSKKSAAPAARHHIEVFSTEAFFICFDPDVRLHHCRSHNAVELVFFKHSAHKAERTVGRFAFKRFVKSLVYRYGIYFFCHLRTSPFGIRRSAQRLQHMLCGRRAVCLLFQRIRF